MLKFSKRGSHTSSTVFAELTVYLVAESFLLAILPLRVITN